MTTITRFAPSPTGDLHIGGVRTALYSWLYAKNKGGKFILRIEDTDKERSTEAAIKVIEEGMEWLGLNHDAKFQQSDRFAIYDEKIDMLLQKGLAYKCYCSKERLDELREQQMANKEKPRYDGHCRNLTEEKSGPYVIRFKNPTEGGVTFDDAVRGTVSVANSELDDLIIKRSDGTPTYNFVVVIDDADMKVTDVLRGEDHISNTPRQINIFKALGYEPPRYAHIPMILGEDGKRLSKRHGALSVLQYREEGYLPEALLNYLVRLGWSNKDQEIFSIEEMINLFNLENISKSAASFNTEKLLWLNQHYLKTLSVDKIASELKSHYHKKGITDADLVKGPAIETIVEILKDRAKTLVEMVVKSKYFYQDKFEINKEAADKFFTNEITEAFKQTIVYFKQIEDWNKDNIKATVQKVLKEFNLKMPKLAQPIRIAISGDIHSPSIDLTLEVLGKYKTIARMELSLGGGDTKKVSAIL